MRGDFRLSVTCPSCSRSVTVVAGAQDGKCPECGSTVPQLTLFSTPPEEKARVSEATVKEPADRKPNRISSADQIRPGSVITTAKDKDKRYIVIDQKTHKGKYLYTCMRIISGEGRELDHRYVCRMDEERLVLLDGVKILQESEVSSSGELCSHNLVSKLRSEHEWREKRAKGKQKQSKHAQNKTNGMNQGNAWNGIKSVKGYVKIFRG